MNGTDRQILPLEGFCFRSKFPKYIGSEPGSGALLRLEDDLQQIICTFDMSCHLRGGLAVRQRMFNGLVPASDGPVKKVPVGGGWGQGNPSLSEFRRERRNKDLSYSDLSGDESVQF